MQNWKRCESPQGSYQQEKRCSGARTCRISTRPPRNPMARQPTTFTASVPTGKPRNGNIRCTSPLITNRRTDPRNPPSPTRSIWSQAAVFIESRFRPKRTNRRGTQGRVPSEPATIGYEGGARGTGGGSVRLRPALRSNLQTPIPAVIARITRVQASSGR